MTLAIDGDSEDVFAKPLDRTRGFFVGATKILETLKSPPRWASFMEISCDERAL